ncbi:MAG: hypothetical protein WDZ51_08995 [Pirellulaceae bacterium]
MVPEDLPSSKTYEKKLCRNGYGSVEAVDPHDGKMWDVLISLEKVKEIAKHSRGKTLELADSVKQILQTPRAVYQGVRELSEDEWWCYVGVPESAYDYKTAQKRAPWPGQVMAIFVTDGRVLYNWYWCEADRDVSYLPKDYKTRFRKKVL